MVQKIERDYTCLWCRTKFKQSVGKVTGIDGGKRQTVSDQVRCPKCRNFIPTWNY